MGAPDWYDFEHEAWGIGESIRRAFVKTPRFKRKEVILAKVAGVVTWRNLRRGRQSFIMAIGFVAARRYAETLVPFLRDPDVDGQVLYTLVKMRAPGFAHEVASLLHAKQTWKRNLAKTYVSRYPSA
jgi:hypothetical protein